MDQDNFMTDNIELLGINWLQEHPELKEYLEKMQHDLALSGGWHYLIDWIWVINNLGDITSKTILDAGAGLGLLQWYLCLQGANIISVDRSNRKCIPFHLVKRFNVTGYSIIDEPLSVLDTINIFNTKANIISRGKALIKGFAGELRSGIYKNLSGSVKLLNSNLQSIQEIPDNSIDIIVSISALEHNPTIENIKTIIIELMRALKPGGKMLITLPATNGSDWFFSPAYSWCFSDATLCQLFDFQKDIPTNFNSYDSIFEGIKSSKELKNNLSLRYFFRSQSGMPWGKWDPKYLPVGVLKTKK
jgi:SAM-dependent methyltransferase